MYFRDQNKIQIGHPMELNFESLEMQKRNVPTERAQIVDEKTEVIFLAIKLNPRVMIVERKIIAHRLYFVLMTATN